MIVFKSVNFSYEQPKDCPADAGLLLKNIELSLKRGEWVTVIGANGSGKSTLARLINGLLLPDSGSVTVDGDDTMDAKKLSAIREKVSYVFQNPDNQMVAAIVEDDVAFGPENLALHPGEIRSRVERALNITGLTPLRHRAVYELSGGEKQRVAIAGALAMASDYLVLDEPTSMLDSSLCGQVLSTLQYLHRELGMGILYITNVMEEVALAERVIVLADGEIVLRGSPQDVFSKGDELSAYGIAIPEFERFLSGLSQRGLLPEGNFVNVRELAEALCR